MCHIIIDSSRILENPFTGQVHLAINVTVNEGLVEVLCNDRFGRGEWGRLCQEDFTQTDADTTCRQLGYHSAYQYNRNLSITE